MQAPPITIAFSLRSLCAPTAILRRCRRPYCAATATTRRSHCALIITPSDGVCFEHAQRAHRRLAFNAISPRPLAMPLRCKHLSNRKISQMRRVFFEELVVNDASKINYHVDRMSEMHYSCWT